ncbi:DNA adenine methylase [Chamaesiphon sp.]|uniref:DNA adenine methylase n=1 Tax=Chamaesiphon sp. TaxID=2814140 RepID=UPI0035937D1C
MAKNKLVAPFLKWVGGKRQIMPTIEQHLPKGIKSYIEPFIGGGAVLFHLQPKNAIINDFNSELVNVYNVIKNDVENLILDLQKHENQPQYFYKIRALDRTEAFASLSNVERASRIIYLNKTCYNGLYRVNNSGEFNSPFGKYKNPNIVNDPTLRAVSFYLNSNNIRIENTDYETILKEADKYSFVYLDPPYYPVSESSNFTGYIQGGWDESDQIRLKEACDRLNQRKIKFLQSNSCANFIKELYADYYVYTVKANRAINSDGEKRGEIEELLIKNYD